MEDKQKLLELHQTFAKSKHGAWIVGFNDFVALYETIKKYNIKKILELGGGVGASTTAMAYAIGEDGHIDSVEAYMKCINIAKRLIPKELQDRVNFIDSNVDIIRLPMILAQSFLSYHEVPRDEDYDMVFIDGPSPVFSDKSQENGFLFDLPGGDFFNLIAQTKPGTIFYIDGRKAMVKIMLRFFANYFLIVKMEEQVSVLKRTDEVVKDNKIFVHDLLHKDLIDKGHFNNEDNFISSDK